MVSGLWHIIPWYVGSLTSLFLIGAISTKDIADVKGDALYDCVTLPIKYGVEKTAYIIAPFLIIPFLMFPLGAYLEILPPVFYLGSLLIVYSFFIIWLILQKPNQITKIEKNHTSWKHVYILYTLMQIQVPVLFYMSFIQNMWFYIC